MVFDTIRGMFSNLSASFPCSSSAPAPSTPPDTRSFERRKLDQELKSIDSELNYIINSSLRRTRSSDARTPAATPVSQSDSAQPTANSVSMIATATLGEQKK